MRSGRLVRTARAAASASVAASVRRCSQATTVGGVLAAGLAAHVGLAQVLHALVGGRVRVASSAARARAASTSSALTATVSLATRSEARACLAAEAASASSVSRPRTWRTPAVTSVLTGRWASDHTACSLTCSSLASSPSAAPQASPSSSSHCSSSAPVTRPTSNSSASRGLRERAPPVPMVRVTLTPGVPGQSRVRLTEASRSPRREPSASMPVRAEPKSAQLTASTKEDLPTPLRATRNVVPGSSGTSRAA